MQNPSSLSDWLARLETMHYKAIDMGLERVAEVRQRLGLDFDCPVITVGGTNGKGSTCAMLEAIFLQGGYRVGLYTSPHLLRFNERARINGAIVTDAALIEQFEAVDAARGELSLTYFEFTTLAILRMFAAAGLDVVILEVGLGGRLDAVNVIDADVAIITSIDLDHTDYLGDTREAIGMEKAGIFRAGKTAICSDPQPPASLLAHAQKIGADLWLFGRDFNYSGDKLQWSYGGREQRRNSLGYPALRGANQLLNASAAIAACEALRMRLPLSAQEIRTGLAMVELPGRFQVLPGRPTVILDVAHNPHAASTLAHNLDNMGFYRFTYAVFGCMQDKDIAGVVAKLKTQVDHWYLSALPIPRAANTEQLETAVLSADVTQSIEPQHDKSIKQFSSPAEAFHAALSAAGEDDRIVVFGSFFTVAGVMEARNTAFH
ncbi:bifunctional tetrahydrofolate synthase/dihydrofolate synthase [Lacisediminimonas sp.]|uniref:bifunctional tetrahydrofolate synthase/dihydrofolate synthase n=1 Tax=Lacisediminimonas sp. TaxID=3060582 RepID=UPI00271AA8F3|nr:bifunctional tetrahydrofolate synthase/dihydrofolate synthase [Lacisediminimonas sp.]MDO8300423.1 bifunctional tetrahydrofolate synthase/dihydrofolate synthase [Lacisediminimonas sp.]